MRLRHDELEAHFLAGPSASWREAARKGAISTQSFRRVPWPGKTSADRSSLPRCSMISSGPGANRESRHRVCLRARPIPSVATCPACIVGQFSRALKYQAGGARGPHAGSRPKSSLSALVCCSKTSYVQTRNDFRTWGPNELMSGISAASRPRATTIRPIRGMLLRGSKVHHHPSRNTSIQALKSIGSTTGTPMSPRWPLT